MKKIYSGNTEKILNSLDGIARAEAGPYFYSKLVTRMQREQLPQPVSVLSRFRPALVIGALVTLVMMNVLLLVSQSGKLTASSTEATAESYTVQAFSEEYSLNTSIDY